MKVFRLFSTVIALISVSLSSTALASQIAPSQFVIDSSKPYVYVKFDHIGARKPAAEGEGSNGLWLRIVNNCNLSITVMTFDLGTGDPGLGVNYSVVPVPGPRGPSEERIKNMPRGYSFDVGTSAKIPPGGSLLFSIPFDRVRPEWYIQLRFDFLIPGPKEGYNPYSLVDFSWEDIPDQFRAVGQSASPHIELPSATPEPKASNTLLNASGHAMLNHRAMTEPSATTMHSTACAASMRFCGHVIPAKNGIPNQDSTTSALATMRLRWAGGCRQTGQRKPSRFPMQSSTIRRA